MSINTRKVLINNRYLADEFYRLGRLSDCRDNKDPDADPDNGFPAYLRKSNEGKADRDQKLEWAGNVCPECHSTRSVNGTCWC